MQHGVVSTLDVDAWIRADPDPEHRAAMTEWSAAGAVPIPLASPLRFGTAGLRGSMGPGPGQMNRVVVRVTARAIGQELVAAGLADRGVVIGHDARPNSDVFAHDSGQVLRALGIPCSVIDGPVPTPVVARLALSSGAAVAIVVTASHNPRGDNGYKVYWADGAQIRSPIDARIEARMDFTDLPSSEDLAPRHEVAFVSPRAAIADYLGSVITSRIDGVDSPRVVYTALCGVGAETLDLAFAAAGLAPPIHVADQRHPDGSFPGLPFPNPEEPGTLDRALTTADEAGIGVVLANDPDADRLGVVVRDGASWRALTGDEIGLLLCERRLRLTEGENRVVASSIVSGGAVPALCRRRGVRHVSTLTGFKWIMRPAIDEPDSTWVFGYEEALGYAVSDRVRDKDGISAAVEFVLLLAELADQGQSVQDHLASLAAEIGTFATDQVSVRGERETLTQALSALRTEPPASAGGAAVTAVEDWLQRPDGEATDLLILRLGDAGRIAIRPSGTEPKVKAYLEWRTEPGDGSGPAHLAAIARDVESWLR